MNGFKRIDDNGFVYYIAQNIENTGFLKHMFTTRLGGVSSGETASLNLGINKNDKKENVVKNFEIVTRKLGAVPDDLIALKQIHTDTVHIVLPNDESKIYNTEDRIRADALASNIKGSCFCVFYADCVPIILADKKTKSAAAVHSGWRSSAMHIVKKAVLAMKENFGANPLDIEAAIGPSIQKCCFETDFDAAEQFDEKYYEKKNGKYFIDLQRLIKDDLNDAGVFKISDCGICTCCNNEEFFSNRAHKGKIGLMGAFVKIN